MIESVQAFPVSYPEPNDHGRHRAVCLVRIRDRDGRVGWGEGTAYFREAAIACAVVVEALAPQLVGTDPRRNVATVDQLRSHAWWYGTEGVGIAGFALSAIDVALWDLKGQVLGERVLDLLGGPVKDRLPVIASSHAAQTEIPAMAEEIADWLKDGLTGVKVGFGKLGDANLGFEHDRDVEFVGAVREAIGPDKRIMVDVGVRNRWSVAEAVRRVQAFEEYGIDWIEEPLGNDDPEGYEKLRQATSTPIAYGEREWSPRGVERILSTGTVDVVGLDPGRVGGVTGFARACDLLELSRKEGNAHAWSTALDTAASLAISWAKPACRQFEEQPFKGPMQADLIGGAIVHRDGYVPEPSGPGLGVTVDEDVVRHFLIPR